MTRLEERALKAEQDGPFALKELLELQDELGRLKIQALDEFTREELTGNALLPSFLVQVNGARDYLARLILQQEGRPSS